MRGFLLTTAVDAKAVSGNISKFAFNLDKAVFFDPETQRRIA